MILMVVLGVLLLSLGACCVGVGRLMPVTELPAAQKQQLDEWARQNHVSVAMIGQMITSAGITSASVAILLLILAIFVFRGSFAGTIVALVVAGLMVLGVGVLMLPGMLFGAAQAPNANSMLGLAMVLIVLGLFIWLVVLLARSIRFAAGRQEDLRRQRDRFNRSSERERRYDQGPEEDNGP